MHMRHEWKTYQQNCCARMSPRLWRVHGPRDTNERAVRGGDEMRNICAPPRCRYRGGAWYHDVVVAAVATRAVLLLVPTKGSVCMCIVK